MNINFKYNDLPEATSLAPIVEQKFGQLDKFLSHARSVSCEAEFEKVAPQQNGQVHRFEANLMIDGTLYRAEATEESFEKAIDEVRNELDKEIRRTQKKRGDLARRAGRALKELIWRQ